jgi:hypothetical protein
MLFATTFDDALTRMAANTHRVHAVKLGNGNSLSTVGLRPTLPPSSLCRQESGTQSGPDASRRSFVCPSCCGSRLQAALEEEMSFEGQHCCLIQTKSSLRPIECHNNQVQLGQLTGPIGAIKMPLLFGLGNRRHLDHFFTSPGAPPLQFRFPAPHEIRGVPRPSRLGFCEGRDSIIVSGGFPASRQAAGQTDRSPC